MFTLDLLLGTCSCLWGEVRALVCPSRDSRINNNSNDIKNHHHECDQQLLPRAVMCHSLFQAPHVHRVVSSL